jgi:hypothetical protein
MDTQQIVALLIAERDRLNRAIEVLQGPTKRRGRPPKNPVNGLVASGLDSTPAKHGRTFTDAQKKVAK